MPKITYKPLARLDLENIWHYTFEKWSVEQAEFYVSEIYKELENVCIHPSIAKLVTFNGIEYLKCGINHHYAFCRLEHDQFVVVRILHEGMDFQRHLS